MLDRKATGLASLIHGSLTPTTEDPQFAWRRAAIKTHLRNLRWAFENLPCKLAASAEPPYSAS
jgi:hypothetical protein